MDESLEPPGEGPWQRFIIRYRDGSGPGRDRRLVQARLDRCAEALAGDASPAPRLSWLRRLGIGADVIGADRPLDRASARRLMETLGADPDVEYVEVDAVMRALTWPGGEQGQA